MVIAGIVTVVCGVLFTNFMNDFQLAQIEKHGQNIAAVPVLDNTDECYNDLVNLAQCLKPLKQSALAKGECDAEALRIRVEKMLEVKNNAKK
jgi:hypothetical protein